jgi:hypothetical protein
MECASLLHTVVPVQEYTEQVHRGDPFEIIFGSIFIRSKFAFIVVEL